MTRHGMPRPRPSAAGPQAKRPRLDPAQQTALAKRLPVRLVEQDVAALVRENQVVVLVAETGSGKTTQVPDVIFIDRFLGSCPAC